MTPRGAFARRWFDRCVAALLPADWREAVWRDLQDERAAGRRVHFPLHIVLIAIRLRAARARDAWRRDHMPDLPIRRRSFLMGDFTRDLRLSIRSAIRRPGYALAIVATLAVGIGANTAIFSMFNWILFRPLPGVIRPDELVTVRYQHPKSAGHFWVAYRDHADLRDNVPAFAALAASQAVKMDFAVDGNPDRLDGEVVTTNYFSLFGVRMTRGREFTDAEEQPGAAPVAVVSRRLWNRAFDDDPAIVGRAITLEGKRFTVIGVAPANFQGRSKVTATDFWIPLGAYTTLQPQSSKTLFTSRRHTMFGDSIGRLRADATVAAAQDAVMAVAANVPGFLNRTANADVRSGIRPVVTAGFGNEAFSEDNLTRIFKLLMSAVGLLLLLASANAANLLLARATGRRREIAVCQAIGASRFRIIRQQLAEGLVLAMVAGGLGLALAYWLLSLFDGMRIISFLPAVRGVGLDWRVCAFAFAAAGITTIVFATMPAIVSSRVDLQASLKDGLTSSRRGRRVLRASLVTVQVTLAVLLLTGAGLFVRTLQNIRALDLGLDMTGVVSLSVQPSRYGYDAKRSHTYIRDLLDRLRRAPGIDAAAYTWTTTFSSNRNDVGFSRADAADRQFSSASSTVSDGYFKTMRIPVLAGRDFSESDLVDSETDGVTILSRGLAEEVFPEGGAIGSRLVLRYPKGKSVEIVGVVGDVRGRRVINDAEPFMYMPAGELSWGMVQVQSSLPTAATIATIRDVARGVDPLVVPYDVEPFSASIDRALSEERLFARLSSLFGVIGVVLAGIGIYGMMSGSVAERRREFGIRLALGARGGSVLRIVIKTSLVLAVAGVVMGVGAAAAVRQFIEARLYGVTALDPLTLGTTAVAIVGLSVLAALVPALRASRVDPVRSLRAE